MKLCKKCEIEKDLNEFYKDPSVKSGLQSTCKKCVSDHSKLRYLENKNEISERNRQWRLKNPEYDKQYYLENKEKVNERHKQYHLKNREKDNEKSRQWYSNNLEKVVEYRTKNKEKIIKYRKRYLQSDRGKILSRLYSLHRRTLRKKNDFAFTFDQQNFMFKYFNNSCVNCGSKEKLHIDHFIPLSKGGPTTSNNLVPLCHGCNCSKKAKMPQEFFSAEILERIETYFSKILEINRGLLETVGNN